ncbi:hypothetical protein UlMin_036578 [Ulmus minor]
MMLIHPQQRIATTRSNSPPLVIRRKTLYDRFSRFENRGNEEDSMDPMKICDEIQLAIFYFEKLLRAQRLEFLNQEQGKMTVIEAIRKFKNVIFSNSMKKKESTAIKLRSSERGQGIKKMVKLRAHDVKSLAHEAIFCRNSKLNYTGNVNKNMCRFLITLLGFIIFIYAYNYYYLDYEHSARCIHCVMVKGENVLKAECTRSKLWLVDLAGSERVAKTEVQGQHLKETQNIIQSLSALSDVIPALATKSPHIPFRNSKLTRLLQDSLGGDSKILMFVQINPNESDLGEILCSLNFASRVKGVELGPTKKQMDTSEYLRYKQMAKIAKLDIKGKYVQIKKMDETVHGLELKIKDRDHKNKNLQEKQQQIKHQPEEQNIAPIRPPFGSQPLGSLKNLNDIPTSVLAKDQENSVQPLAEKNIDKTTVPFYPMNEFVKYIDHKEKENIPEMMKSLYMTIGKEDLGCTCSKVHSLIPFPSTTNTTQLPLPLLPIAPSPADKKEETDELETNSFPNTDTFLQKRIQTKSPIQQNMKRCVNVGTDKVVRVSIGSQGRLAQRVLLSNARVQSTTKVISQK